LNIPMQRTNRWAKARIEKLHHEFIQLEDAPRAIALGFSLGIMIGMTPFFGAHIASSVVLAAALRWSKIAAAIGVQVTNIGTAPLIYPVNYWVGVKLSGYSRHVALPESIDYGELLPLLGQSPLILIDLCVGGLVLGIPIACGGYFLVLWLLKRLHKRHRGDPS